MIDEKQFIWTNRYSDTDEPDQHGRWARQLSYKGKRICWVTKVRYTNFFKVVDYFPSTGNDSPCFSGVSDDDLVVIKHKAEQRFVKFINDIL